MSKKVIMLLAVLVAVLVVSSICLSTFASEKKDLNQITSEQNEKKVVDLTPEQMKLKQTIVQKFELQEKANRYGLDTNGLTDEELKAKVSIKEIEENLEKAKKLGIDVSGLANEQIKEKVTAKESEAILEKAKKAGIETTGLTAEQVKAVITEKDKETSAKKGEAEKEVIYQMAQRYEIDAGLPYEEIKAKVNEKMMPVLVEKAEQIGIDSTGLNYDQLLQKVKAKEIEIIENDAKKNQ